MLYVNPWDWMEDEVFPAKNSLVRKNLLRVARLIEYGAELKPREMRMTLVECTKRPRRKPCQGFLVVVKGCDGDLHAECASCGKDRISITNWEGTPWSEGIPKALNSSQLEVWR